MKVAELIAELQKMPQDANVWHLWDGDPRTQIAHVWLSRAGAVVTADSGMMCYSTNARPPEAPDSKTDLYWKSPGEAGYLFFGDDDEG